MRLRFCCNGSDGEGPFASVHRPSNVTPITLRHSMSSPSTRVKPLLDPRLLGVHDAMSTTVAEAVSGVVVVVGVVLVVDVAATALSCHCCHNSCERSLRHWSPSLLVPVSALELTGGSANGRAEHTSAVSGCDVRRREPQAVPRVVYASTV